MSLGVRQLHDLFAMPTENALYQRQWRAKNPEKCLAYDRAQKKRTGRKALNEKARQWRADNPSYHHKRRSLYRAFICWLKELPCADCGKHFPPECLDFDHVRGQKTFLMSLQAYVSARRLQSEVMKCEIVCANCHRTRTKERREHESRHKAAA